MNFDFISTALAQGTQGAPSASKGVAPMLPMFLAIFVIFYFFLIRPQQKKSKDAQHMMDSLTKGDRVVTIGGIHGTIANIKKKGEKNSGDDIVVLKVAENTKLEMLRSAIARVIAKEEDAAAGKE